MQKKAFGFLCVFLALCFHSFAQGPWTQKASFGGLARHRPFTFSVGSKGYLGCGWNGVTMYDDFWEYDPATNTWTQKANYPAGPRLSAFGFSVGTKGYAGAGLDQFLIAQPDFYQYDPATNLWTAKAMYPATPIFGASAVVVANKAYVCFGDEWDPNYIRHGELYVYNPAVNTWNYLSTFPGTARRDAVGFAIGSKAYFGTGNDENYFEMKDFWQYNPTTNSWTQKADFGGTERSQAVGFSVCEKGYIGTGGTYDEQDFWEYSDSTNTWTQINDFLGAGRENSSTFVINNKAYVACGTSGINYKDLWEFNPAQIIGISEIKNGTNIKIYPNPIVNQAIVEFSEINNFKNLYWEIIDLNGKKMNSENIHSSTFFIQRNNLAAGNYLLLIRSNEKIISSQKIIIQ